jgi:hypothetical protein
MTLTARVTSQRGTMLSNLGQDAVLVVAWIRGSIVVIEDCHGESLVRMSER